MLQGQVFISPSGNPIMQRLHHPRFSIQGLMVLIGAVACTLALLRWLGPLALIVIAVFPFSLLVERLFGATPPAPRAQTSFDGAAANLVGLILCASLSTLASWYAFLAGVPTVRSPFPFFVIVPLVSASSPGYEGFWWNVAPIPFGTFLLMNLYQLRETGSAPLRMRFSVLLVPATVLSFLYFALGWAYGVRFQGVSHTLAVGVINLLFLLVLWGWWLAIERRTSKTAALGFATLLHCWLFWFAFPYLGELP